MNPQTKKDTAVRVLKALSLLLLILFAIVSILLLFALVPMLLFGGSVQLDSGGFLDLLLRRTQHASGVIPASLVFLGALPLLVSCLLLLGMSIVLFLYLRQVKKRGAWFFDAGKRYWIAACVLGALNAAVPKIVSILAVAPVAASGTFAVRPWNPLGGILLFAVTLALTVVYSVKAKRQPAPVAETPPETEAP